MQDIKLLKKQLSLPKKIAITTHHKPDADALGSSLAMASYLKKKNHQVTVVSPSDYPCFLHWMKGNDEVINFEEEGKGEKVANILSEADIVFCLDFSNLSRINEMGELVRSSKAYIVNIDHHQDPEDFADFAWVDDSAAATCELVYELIVQMGDRELIDPDIADCLYAGIMTDTGGFRHPNTTKNVHQVTAELISLGADNSKISKLIYDTNSINKLKFIGFALTRRLVILQDLQTAYFAISKKDLKKYNSQTGDTEGLVNYALSLDGIKLAALFTERKDSVKISFRTAEDVVINKFAGKYFEGGGHKNASGGKSDLNLAQTTEKFEKLVKENQKSLF